jgi:hypothetical protein
MGGIGSFICNSSLRYVLQMNIRWITSNAEKPKELALSQPTTRQ